MWQVGNIDVLSKRKTSSSRVNKGAERGSTIHFPSRRLISNWINPDPGLKLTNRYESTLDQESRERITHVVVKLKLAIRPCYTM